MPRSAAFTSEAVAPAREAFAHDVRRGLSARPKRLPPRWLYDSLGSALFESIGQLPWYRITRAELKLLTRCAPVVASQMSGPVDLIELGVGDGRKLLLVARALAAARRLGTVHLVDVSARALEAGAQAISRDTAAVVIGHERRSRTVSSGPRTSPDRRGSFCFSARTSATSIRPRRRRFSGALRRH